ncbi:hypothetical protein AB1Y20_008139 [Prymnesium parvum]|uniref:Nucleotide-diphospho-sugar transferase domain-containing protein n=1 Tax=Prymnesium parvum TaxID=97485 RepID=A0AB34IWD3_PRYPA
MHATRPSRSKASSPAIAAPRGKAPSAGRTQYELRQLPLVRSLGFSQLWVLSCPSPHGSRAQCSWNEKRAVAFAPRFTEHLSPEQRCGLRYPTLAAAKQACERHSWCDGVRPLASAECTRYSAAELRATRSSVHAELSRREAEAPRRAEHAVDLASEVKRLTAQAHARKARVARQRLRGVSLAEAHDRARHFAALGVSEREALHVLAGFPRFRGAAATPRPVGGRGCRGNLVMVESRDHRDLSKYYSQAVAINRAYALRHNYTFALLTPRAGPWLQSARTAKHSAVRGMPWCKVKALQWVVRQQRSAGAEAGCAWTIFLDSDSLVHRRDVPLADYLEEGAGSAEVVFLINTGVLFLRHTAWVEDFLEQWQQTHDSPACREYQFRSYVEQGCLERLLVRKDLHLLLPAGFKQRVALAPMPLFNSPWGSLIKHIWGGVGKEMRNHTFETALLTFAYQAKDSARRKRWNIRRFMPRSHELVDFPC